MIEPTTSPALNPVINVYIKRNIPFITSGLKVLFFGFLFILVIFFLLSFPRRYGSGATNISYLPVFNTINTNSLTITGLAGVLLSGILLHYLHFNRKATLILNEENIIILGKWLKMSIPVNKVRRIYVLDLKTLKGDPKNIFKLEILDRMGKTVDLRIINYDDTDKILQCLTQYTDTQILFHDRNVASDFGEERESGSI